MCIQCVQALVVWFVRKDHHLVLRRSLSAVAEGRRRAGVGGWTKSKCSLEPLGLSRPRFLHSTANYMCNTAPKLQIGLSCPF